MAFFTPSLSPAVVVREIDLTGIVPNAGTTTGVFVGNYRWGPVDKPTFVDNEARLVSIFATPDINNTVDFHSAAHFSKYSNQLLNIRAVTSAAKNSFDSDTTNGVSSGVSQASTRTARLVKNETDFNNQLSAMDSDGHSFVAKYPGSLGNSLQIQMCGFDTGDSAFTDWSLRNQFDAAPGTSTYASGKNATNDEVHVAVVDQDGLFTGTKGDILETFPYLSLARNAKNPDGSSNYIKDVLNNQSNYVWLVDAANIDSDYRVAGAGTDADSGDDFKLIASKQGVKTVSFVNGANSGSLTTSEYASAFDLIEDVDTYQVDFLIAPPVTAVFLLGIIWKRVNSDAAITTLFMGLFLLILRLGSEIYFQPQISAGESVDGFLFTFATINFAHMAIILFIFSVILCVSVSLITAEPDYQRTRGLSFGNLDPESLNSKEKTYSTVDVVLSIVLVGIVISILMYFTA